MVRRISKPILSACLITLPVLGLALGLIGCRACPSCEVPPPVTDPVEARQIPEAMKADASSVVQGNNAFACDLYQQIRSQEGNLLLSPYSLSAGLSMTYAGARGGTEAELSQVLHITLPQTRFHDAFGALHYSLDRGNSFGGYRLDSANTLWGQQGRVWADSFLSTLRWEYEAPLQELDFAVDPEGSRRQVNTWVSGHTQGKIPELMDSGTIDSSTVLVLANAIYFKGRWASQFDKGATSNGTFQLDASHAVDVPFMNQTGIFPLKQVTGLRILELPYQGKDLSMVILLPEAMEGLADLETQLTVENLASWTTGLNAGEVSLSLPRFSFSSAFSLKNTLSALGMPSAFSATEADFSGMDGQHDIFLQYVEHKAFVAVDEEGTTAAAGSGITGGATSTQPLQIDHPFLFLILDRVTGSVIFLGRVQNPSL